MQENHIADEYRKTSSNTSGVYGESNKIERSIRTQIKSLNQLVSETKKIQEDGFFLYSDKSK